MSREDEWLWGWDPTPGIVSVWADGDGRATVWRRVPDAPHGPDADRTLVRDDVRFRPWLLLDSLADLQHLGAQLRPDEGATVEPGTTNSFSRQSTQRKLPSAAKPRPICAHVSTCKRRPQPLTQVAVALVVEVGAVCPLLFGEGGDDVAVAVVVALWSERVAECGPFVGVVAVQSAAAE